MRRRSSSSCGAAFCWARMSRHPHRRPQVTAPVELTATAAFMRRGAETKLVLPGLAPQKHSSRCDPALIKAIARGRAWFEELVSGRARSLQLLAKRDGISRRYIRRLISLAFLSPQLVEAIL